MFLSQLFWESAGLSKKEEVENRGSYISSFWDHPNQLYYGK
jgi:hypothetical protein